MSLRAGLAGYGWWGRHLALRLRAMPELYQLITIAEPDPERRAAAEADGFDTCAAFENLLADESLAVLLLATPHMAHEAQITAAAAAGKHVFCEKPLGLTAASARASVAAMTAAGRQLGIGHERRFEPALIRLKALVASGALGRVVHAEAAFSHNKLAGLPPGSWRTSASLSPGGAMTATGIHLTDLFLWLLGTPTRVSAEVRDHGLGWETGEATLAQISFASGATAHLQALLNVPHFMRLQLFGTEGWVEIRNLTHPDTPGGETLWLQTDRSGTLTEERFDWSCSVSANLRAWAAALAGEAPYPWSGADLIANIALYEAICRSAAAGGAPIATEV